MIPRMAVLLALAAALAPQVAPQLLPPSELFGPLAVDHRRSQSPVKHQGDRGTCAAFALCGALETFPGVPTDLNEQLLYATVKLFERDVDVWVRQLGGELLLDEGNALREYLPLFEVVGTCHESVWPYDPREVKAGPEVPEEIRRYLELARIGEDELRGLRDAAGKWGFRAADCEVLEGEDAQDVGRMKAALASGVLAIPVGYAVHAGNWSNLETAGLAALEAGAAPGAIIHPGMLEEFALAPAQGEPAWLPYLDAYLLCRAEQKDLVGELREGRWLQRAHSVEDEYGGHAVLLVGYDERGFLVKNSWGTGWGDGGYCVVSYDYHRLYAGAALVLRDVRLRVPVVTPLETTARMKSAAYRVKVQPRKGPLGDVVQVSSWLEDLRDPNIEVVEYILEVRDTSGAWRALASQVLFTGPPDARTGAPWTLGAVALSAIAPGADARLRVRYGADPLDPADPRSARFVAERVFPRFPAAPTSAVDLLPE